MRSDVLRHALYTLIQKAPKQIEWKHKPTEKSADPFLSAFDGEVDRVFFAQLFDELAETGEAAIEQRKRWVGELLKIAKATLIGGIEPQRYRHQRIGQIVAIAEMGRLICLNTSAWPPFRVWKSTIRSPGRSRTRSPPWRLPSGISTHPRPRETSRHCGGSILSRAARKERHRLDHTRRPGAHARRYRSGARLSG
jgi:hypothetical protein